MSIRKVSSSIKLVGATCLLAFASVSQAQITAFTDDFESYGTAGVPSVSTFAPWLGFSDNCGLGTYAFTPETAGPPANEISALAYNGTDNQYLNYFANYANAPCHAGLPTQEAISVYRQFSFSAADADDGDTWVFSFLYREADVPPTGSTEVGAFIRAFDGSFNLLREVTLDTSGSNVFQTGSLTMPLDPLWDTGGFLQVGFSNLVGGLEGSGMFYDDVSLTEAADADAFVDIYGFTGSPANTVLHPTHNDTGVSPFLDDTITVAVFGASTGVGDPINLNTDDIDDSTLTLGPGLAGVSAAGQYNLNLDADGLDDARFEFKMSEAAFTCSHDAGVIAGDVTTGGGSTFAGVDSFVANCSPLCH